MPSLFFGGVVDGVQVDLCRLSAGFFHMRSMKRGEGRRVYFCIGDMDLIDFICREH